MESKRIQESAKWPKDPSALKRLKQQIQLGEIGELKYKILPLLKGRYLVTYMNSQTSNRIRSATVVSVTNQSRSTNRVGVFYYKGLVDRPVGVCYYSIPPGLTVDFATRDLPTEITTVNCVSNPELTYDEGRAIVSSWFPQIAVSSRVIYTEGAKDTQLLAISDSNIVDINEGNEGD